MRYEIRARSFGEILDMGFRLCLDQFQPLMSIAAPLYVLLFLMAVVTPTPGTTPDVGAGVPAGTLISFLGLFVALIVVWPVVASAITYALAEQVLGRAASIETSLRVSMAVFLPLAGTGLLAALMVGGGFLLLFIPGIYLMLSFLLVNQVCMVERTFGMAALWRSRDLMRGNLLRGFGVMFVASLIAAVLGAGFSLIGLVPLIGPLLQPLPRVLALIFESAVAVVLYFDIRCRKEAFDIQHLAQVVGEGGGAPAAAAVPQV